MYLREGHGRSEKATDGREGSSKLLLHAPARVVHHLVEVEVVEDGAHQRDRRGELVVKVVDDGADLHPEHHAECEEREEELEGEEKEVDDGESQRVDNDGHLGDERRGELDHL